MFREVKIGEKTVPMQAVASVDYYYKAAFRVDPIALQADLSIADGAAVIDLYLRMGFIMAMFAQLHDRKAMLQLNEDGFIEWLDDFDRADLLDAIPEIRAVYDGERSPSESSKKNNDKPNGE